MARVTIQMGHCFRAKGRTGGRGEQQFAREVGRRMQPALEARGHSVELIGADDGVPPGDVFVALHTDGSVRPDRRGASVGYPDDRGGRLAAAWKRAHQRAGYSGGFLPDNYTTNLRSYYAFARTSEYGFAFLAEHGHHSNDEDFRWLHANYDACALAHVCAISEVVGDPRRPSTKPVVADPTPTSSAVDVMELRDGTIITVAADGRVFVEGDHAHFRGSMDGTRMNAPIIGAAMTESEEGYWLVGADGGLFAFNAPVIQPYAPLMKEYARGERRIVKARRRGSGLLLLSNLGERYVLQP